MKNDFAHGKLEIHGIYNSMRCGSQAVICIELSNFSESIWQFSGNTPIRLSYHWAKQNGKILVWDGLRSAVPKTKHLAPGESIKTQMLVDVPNKPGSYVLMLTLVQETVGWFEESPAFQAVKLDIQVNSSDQTNTKILLIGNCQSVEIARLIKAMSDSNVTVSSIQTTFEITQKLFSGEYDISSKIAESDLILVHSEQNVHELIYNKYPKARFKTRIIPTISFTAFHPDLCHITTSKPGVVLQGPLSDYQSAIIFYAWSHGYSITETMNLFCEEIFNKLGYFDYYTSSVNFLTAHGKNVNFPLDNLLESWTKHGCWLHTSLHPKLFVLADLTRAIFHKEGLTVLANVEEYIHDHFGFDMPVWPVYPEIAQKLGIEGNYQFKSTEVVLNLEEFIQASFQIYSQYKQDDLVCVTIASSRFLELDAFLKNKNLSESINSANPISQNKLSVNVMSSNPYHDLKDYHFWRRAIEKINIPLVDPVISSSFLLNPETKVATAGSCFAQHISRALDQHGFNFFITEKRNDISLEESHRRNYGVFSARFGNLYTSRQLLQLFDRAFGTFEPTEIFWMRSDGKYIDPFRPQIEPDGFTSIEELQKSRADHFGSVRSMFENLDVFVFTLGLTESWQNKIDGAVYPLAPGVVAGEINPNLHEFINFSVAEVIQDLGEFITKLAKINPKAKMLLTVSPVPLIATYENQHVLVATTYSKSVLLVAANEICKNFPMCAYFPSYEIITGHYNKGQYFENDLRSINQKGVEHVMRLFLLHYAKSESKTAFEDELMKQNLQLSKVLCDEEAINT